MVGRCNVSLGHVTVSLVLREKVKSEQLRDGSVLIAKFEALESTVVSDK
jgi:hypothetical protein